MSKEDLVDLVRPDPIPTTEIQAVRPKVEQDVLFVEPENTNKEFVAVNNRVMAGKRTRV